ncbi:methyltransferase [Thermus thermophilus]|uniref:SAM-dependent methyltransferase n=1 Tax=Thermus thermophilus TaxID=274 RepID=UPI00090AAA5A|nr:SAM-dependent methyltransferase [Thermus thermophilus]BAW00629.1 methyltransferase [Thermus thermophilus]BDB11345.1 methyltransferase [Thermus thermophilus]
MPRDWDAFYREAQEERKPAFVVRAYGPFVPEGPVLDLAGGLGRNARYFLGRGHPVVLVEKSREALKRLRGTPGLSLLELDLEAPGALARLPQGPFAGIVMAYYVNRPLLQGLAPLLLPGGLLLVEGFTRKEAQRRGRPHSPFYWEGEELLTPPPGLALRAFGEGWMGGYRAYAVYLRP